jgi:uncharacterized membrane-anchored protein YhcB (DUF1043 family)
MTIDIQSTLSIIALVGGFIVVWVSIHVRLKALEIEVKQLQKNEDKNGEKFDQIMDKIEEVGKGTAERVSEMNQKFNELILEFTKLKK